MSNDKITIKKKEKDVMDVLKSYESISKDRLASETDMKEVAIMRTAMWLEDKDLVKIMEEPIQNVKVTKTGRKLIEKGLPEQRVLEHDGFLEDIPVNDDIINMALGWIREKELGKIINKDDKPFLKITDKGKRFLKREPEEIKVLKELKSEDIKAQDLDEKITENLKSRGAIEIERRSEKFIKLTEKGKNQLEKGFEVKKEISKLSSDMLKNEKYKEITLKPFNVSADVEESYPGKKHFVNQAIEYVRQIWLEMGFQEMDGPLVDTSFWVFDALFQPQDHPARDLQDTFYMKNPKKGSIPEKKILERVKEAHENGGDTNSTGWGYEWDIETAEELILRTHTTSLSARTLSSLNKEDLPAKFFSVGKCFRNEKFDWTHLAEFYQVDGIVVSESVTFQNLLGYLERFLNKMGYDKIRFRPGYFPYTEPSVEAEVYHKRKEEWVELLGAGIFRPEVTAPLFGEEINVLAWGPGFGRIMMDYYNIDDIRELYGNDLKQLRESKLWMRY